MKSQIKKAKEDRYYLQEEISKLVAEYCNKYDVHIDSVTIHTYNLYYTACTSDENRVENRILCNASIKVII